MKFFLFAFLLFPCVLTAQSGYKTGDVLADLKIAKLLNHPLTSSSLNLTANQLLLATLGLAIGVATP